MLQHRSLNSMHLKMKQFSEASGARREMGLMLRGLQIRYIFHSMSRSSLEYLAAKAPA
jgi:hypothetical protein